MTDRHTPTRRGVLSAGAVAALGAGAVSACSSDEVTAVTESAASAAGQAAASAAAGAAEGVAAALTDIPVGGAVVKEVAGQKVVIAQPQAGTVVAFSAICTHQGCTVAANGDKLVCPCHGSEFAAATGAVTKGPATADLKSLSVSVGPDGVTLG